MKVYTITVAVADDREAEVQKDWKEVAAACRLVAQHVTQHGVPTVEDDLDPLRQRLRNEETGTQVRLLTGARSRTYLSVIDLPAELVEVDR